MPEPSSPSGLDIAKDYWLNWGKPWFASKHPELIGEIGVGLFSGSDVLGADDEFSRDHGWGPRFEVFRMDEHGVSNEALESEMNVAAPREWGGHRSRYQFAPSISVHTADQYFGDFFASHRLPRTPRDWVCCEHKLANLESHLYFVRHGAVLHDPKGILSDMRARLHAYPEDVWLLRMAQLCFDIAHYGEYNFCWRLTKRKDPVAAQMAVGYFQHAVMALALVMDRDYAPYWKWLHHVFLSHKIAARLDGHLVALASTLEYEPRAERITTICAVLMEELVSRGIVPGDLDDGSGLPLFFQARASLLGRISDPAIK